LLWRRLLWRRLLLRRLRLPRLAGAKEEQSGREKGVHSHDPMITFGVWPNRPSTMLSR
jgi:hypothetical protein